MNNFKELEKLQEEEYHGTINGIKSRIDSNLATIGVFAKIIDVYFSKIINYIPSLSGGSEENLNNKDQ